MPSTHHPAVLADLALGIREGLGNELIGLYLYGSLVSGGFDPNASDVDLVAVTRSDADRLDLGRLRRVHDAVVALHPGWADRIEVAYVGRSTLASFRLGGPVAVISPGEPFHLVEGADLYLQNWYLVRLTSVALTGPPREEVFPEISSDEFVSAVARYAEEVRGRSVSSMSPGMRAYSVLTMCRALRTVLTRAPCSKLDGAELTRHRHPEWGVAHRRGRALPLVRRTAGLRRPRERQYGRVLQSIDRRRDRLDRELGVAAETAPFRYPSTRRALWPLKACQRSMATWT